MKKYLVLLIFVMQGTVGMLSVKELSGYLSNKGMLCPFVKITDADKAERIEKLKVTDFTKVCDSNPDFVYLIINMLINMKYYFDAATLITNSYNHFCSDTFNDYWLVADILKEGKKITVENVIYHLKNIDKVDSRLLILGHILDDYTNNKKECIPKYDLSYIDLFEAMEYINGYNIYKGRKLLPQSKQKEIKSAVLELIKRKFKQDS